MQEEKNFCAFCNNVAKQKCSACQAVYYCNKEHQILHWKTHLTNCRAYKLVENSKLGRHYVAIRDLKVGEIVVHDKAPLITAPGHMRAIKIGNGNFTVSLDAPPKCLNCYVELTAGTAQQCRKCGWPLCQVCTKHGTECEFTRKHRDSKVNISKNEYGKPHPAYEIIGVIRALALRENDPKSYQKLMKLQDFTELGAEYDLQSVDRAARFAKTFLNIEDVPEAEIRKIIGIMMINSLTITTRHEYAAVYDNSSYIEHNCRSNCSKTTTNNEGIIFWAAVPISKGDHITTSYIKPFMGTKQRRLYLSSVKFFDCDCERCKDPTEFGTMFNAIKCTKSDCNGYALPPTFLVPGKNHADFVCLTCNRTVPRALSDAMEQCIIQEKAALIQDDIFQYGRFINKFRAYFHENNSHIFEVEIDLALAIAYNPESIVNAQKEDIADVLKLLKKLTRLLEILAPAENTMRATVLYLTVGVTACANESATFKEKLVMSAEFQKDLNEAERLLSREPACHIFEYSMLQSVRMHLQNLKQFDYMAKLTRPERTNQNDLNCVIQ